MAHRSRAASLRKTSPSAAASRAPSVPSASSSRTVVRSRVTFFIGRCRSTRTLSLKDRRGGVRIQSTHRPTPTPKARTKKKNRAPPPPPHRPSTPDFSALKDGLRSPVLRWRPNLKVPPRDGSQSLGLDRDTRVLALFALRAGETKEVEMLNSMKSGVPEKDKNATANAAEVMGRSVQPH